jgi:fructose-bisphosphate aldolase class I
MAAFSGLSDAQKAALKATADAMSAPGKGFLASDESAGPWLRAGHVDAKKIEDTAENRAAYRSMLYKTPGLSEYVSGVILHKETLFQCDATGAKMVDLITGNGMIPGIKLDKGYDKKLGLAGTAAGPLGHQETWCKGIDDLEQRCADAYAAGARFAKWRNVLQIDPASGIPSDLAISVCVRNLAEYAAICQRQGLVPIVEPEIVPNGTHGIEVCAAVTELVLVEQFAALKLHNVYLEGAVLKPNMVKNGIDGPKASPAEVADLTVAVLKRTVPSAMPGIFFLSGETALDEDNEETATINLNAMHARHKNLPWALSFSFGKALQKTCIVTWMGKTANEPAAQKALLDRAKANFVAASVGTYVPGSCASVGAKGNTAMQGGAY